MSDQTHHQHPDQPEPWRAPAARLQTNCKLVSRVLNWLVSEVGMFWGVKPVLCCKVSAGEKKSGSDSDGGRKDKRMKDDPHRYIIDSVPASPALITSASG